MFGFGGPQSTPTQAPSFGTFNSFQQPQQQQVVAATPGVHLLTKNAGQPNQLGQPVTFSTKWDDLHPSTQQLLEQIEKRILEYRDESRRLDQSARLYDTNSLRRGFEEDAAAIQQGLAALAAAINAEQQSCISGLFHSVRDLLLATESAVRSFLMLRHRFTRPAHPSTGATPGAPSPSIPDFYTGIPALPSPYLKYTVARFDHTLASLRQRVEELERLLSPTSLNQDLSSDTPLVQSLPAVLANLHQFFLHVAAGVEALHSHMAVAREAYLADRRRRGDDRDPFLEADRREEAKRAAAAKAVHPGLLPGAPTATPTSTPATTPTLFSSTPAASSGGGLFSSATPAGTTGGGLFGSTTPAGATGGSLFPSASTGGGLLGSSTAGGLFGSTASKPATGGGLFGASTPAGGTTPSLFGSTPAGGTSLFGGAAQSGGSAPSFSFATPQGAPLQGASGSMFGTPAAGAAATPAPVTGGSLFGGTPQPATPGGPLLWNSVNPPAAATGRPKARSTRRK